MQTEISIAIIAPIQEDVPPVVIQVADSPQQIRPLVMEQIKALPVGVHKQTQEDVQAVVIRVIDNPQQTHHLAMEELKPVHKEIEQIIEIAQLVTIVRILKSKIA